MEDGLCVWGACGGCVEGEWGGGGCYVVMRPSVILLVTQGQ